MSRNKAAMMTSNNSCWETPQELFDLLDQEFHFTLDAAATPRNTKCNRFFTEFDNALTKEWYGNVFCNPPYGRDLRKWVEKACEECLIHKHADSVVMLLPARTDTIWFHAFCWGVAEVRFIKGRLRFLDENEERHDAPFPSMIVIWRNSDSQRGVS